MSIYEFEKNDLTYSSIDNTSSCDLIEKEYQKLKIELLKKEKEIQALKSDLSIFKSSSNNTSSQFPLPSEFKDQWLNFIQFTLMESFDTIFLKKIVLSIAVQVSFRVIYSMTKELINSRLSFLLNSLGINEVNESIIQYFYSKYKRLLLQEYYKTLFKCDDEFIRKTTEAIEKELFEHNQFNYDFCINDKEDIMNDLNSKEINAYIKEGFGLCLYMNLHEPPLMAPQKNKVEHCYYNKNDYIVIEGFVRGDNTPCLILLHPPMLKENMPFNGIKAAICVCDDATEDIISQCNHALTNKHNALKPRLLNVYSDGDNNNDDLIEGDAIIRSDSSKCKTVFMNSVLSSHLKEQKKASSSTNIFSTSLPNSNEEDYKNNYNNNDMLTQQQNRYSASNLITLKCSNPSLSQGKALLNEYLYSDEDNVNVNINANAEITLKTESKNSNNSTAPLQHHHLLGKKSKQNSDNQLYNKFIYSGNWFWLSRNSANHGQYNSYTNFNKYQIIKPTEYTLNAASPKQIDSITELNHSKTPMSKVKKYALYSHNNNNKINDNHQPSHIQQVSSNNVEYLSKTIPTSNEFNTKQKKKMKNNSNENPNGNGLGLPVEIEIGRRTSLNQCKEEKRRKFNEGSHKEITKGINQKVLKSSCSYKTNNRNKQSEYMHNLRMKALNQTKRNNNHNHCAVFENKYPNYNPNNNNFYSQDRSASLNQIQRQERVLLTSSNRLQSGRVNFKQLSRQGNKAKENTAKLIQKHQCKFYKRVRSNSNQKESNNKIYFNTISFENQLLIEAKAETIKQNQTMKQTNQFLQTNRNSKSRRKKSFPLKYN